MKKRVICELKIRQFEAYLRDAEKSEATIEKYMRDVGCFAEYVGQEDISKQIVLKYKSGLLESYAVSSANSMIAAVNSFMRFCGWHDLCVKQFKIQRQIYCSEAKELTRTEYFRLLETARDRKIAF